MVECARVQNKENTTILHMCSRIYLWNHQVYTVYIQYIYVDPHSENLPAVRENQKPKAQPHLRAVGPEDVCTTGLVALIVPQRALGVHGSTDHATQPMTRSLVSSKCDIM